MENRSIQTLLLSLLFLLTITGALQACKTQYGDTVAFYINEDWYSDDQDDDIFAGYEVNFLDPEEIDETSSLLQEKEMEHSS